MLADGGIDARITVRVAPGAKVYSRIPVVLAKSRPQPARYREVIACILIPAVAAHAGDGLEAGSSSGGGNAHREERAFVTGAAIRVQHGEMDIMKVIPPVLSIAKGYIRAASEVPMARPAIRCVLGFRILGIGTGIRCP
jgi:hypothetical protein